MTAVAASEVREKLLEALESGRGYAFLDPADSYLHSCPDDSYVRLMAVREYLKLGLVLPAKELLAGAEFSGAESSSWEIVRAALRSVRGSALSWHSSVERFEANLAVWRDGAHAAKRIRENWKARHNDVEWLRDSNGADQIRIRGSDGRRAWFPFLGHHCIVDEARKLPDGIGEITPGPYLLDGLDLGHYFRRVYDATLNTFLGYSCALFVVEPDPVLFAIVLHLHDWRDILADPRVHWFVGDDWRESLQRVWDADPDLPFPRQAFRLSRLREVSAPTAVEIVVEAGQHRERAIRESLDDLERRYQPRDVAYWAARFEEALSGRGPSLRILAAVSIHTTFLQHSMRDAQRAFESLGHRCVVLTEANNHAVTGPLSYHRAIRKFDPDLFFILDHLRPEFPALIPKNLPILTWDQDQLPQVFTRTNMEQVAPHDFLVGCSKSRWVMHGRNPKQFLHARLPTCPEQFGGDPLTNEERRRYACDVSYVSHASQTPQAFHQLEIARCANPQVARLLNVIYEMLPAYLTRHCIASGYVAECVLQEVGQRFGFVIQDPELRNWLRNWYIWRLGDRLFRHEALEWAGKWARRTGRFLRLYGNGWERHPTLAEFAAGPATNGRELVCVYRASAINLQLMPAGFIHQRALDGLAGGGFFLTRRVPQDFLGKALRRLKGRIDALGICGTQDLVARKDETLGAWLKEYLGDRMNAALNDCTDLLQEINLAAELTYPDEVFPRFDAIGFDSEAEFARRAEGFLANEGARKNIADEMRQVVVEQYSYRTAMHQFLQSMAGYLQGCNAHGRGSAGG